jgi:hypothetical protein
MNRLAGGESAAPGVNSCQMYVPHRNTDFVPIGQGEVGDGWSDGIAADNPNRNKGQTLTDNLYFGLLDGQFVVMVHQYGKEPYYFEMGPATAGMSDVMQVSDQSFLYTILNNSSTKKNWFATIDQNFVIEKTYEFPVDEERGGQDYSVVAQYDTHKFVALFARSDGDPAGDSDDVGVYIVDTEAGAVDFVGNYSLGGIATVTANIRFVGYDHDGHPYFHVYNFTPAGADLCSIIRFNKTTEVIDKQHDFADLISPGAFSPIDGQIWALGYDVAIGLTLYQIHPVTGAVTSSVVLVAAPTTAYVDPLIAHFVPATGVMLAKAFNSGTNVAKILEVNTVALPTPVIAQEHLHPLVTAPAPQDIIGIVRGIDGRFYTMYSGPQKGVAPYTQHDLLRIPIGAPGTLVQVAESPIDATSGGFYTGIGLSWYGTLPPAP